MRDYSFYLLVVSILFPIIQAYRKPDKIYELPFLISVAVCIFLFPTLIAVKDNRNTLDDTEYIRYCFVSALCFWFAIAGYHFYKFNPNNKGRDTKIFFYDDAKMSKALYAFLIMSFFLNLVIGNANFENTKGGVFAILIYFIRFMRPATIMLFISYLLKPNKTKLIFLLISLSFSLQTIFIYGRRSEIFTLFITIMFPLYFVKGIKIKRIFLIPGILISIFVFVFFPVARVYTSEGNFSQVFNLSVKDILVSYVEADKSNEIVEAAENMDAASRSGKYNYGVTVYNNFVWQFASSTLFGESFKQSITATPNLDIATVRSKYSKNETDYFKFWLAPTGFAAAFYEFGYYGCLLFLVFSMIVKRLYDQAKKTNRIDHIMFYSIFSTFILFAVYDSILTIPTFVISYLIVFYTATRYSRIKKQVAIIS